MLIVMATNQAFKDLLNSHLPRVSRGVSTVAELVRVARVPASAVSMVISGQRALRHDVAEQLAEVLSDGGAERKRLVERLLRQGQVPPATAGMARQRLRTRLRESVVARVQKGEGINVGVVVCEPFINADGQSGFAADLFRRLASLMHD
jgi:hypothetical protein